MFIKTKTKSKKKNNLFKSFNIGVYVIAIITMTFSFAFIPVQNAKAVTGSIAGKILAGGTPVSQGTVGVNISIPFSAPVQSGGVNSAGEFLLENIPAGTYQVSVSIFDPSLGSYVGVTLENINVDSSLIDLGNINLVPATKTISGKVTRSDSGVAVANAQVDAFKFDGTLNKSTTTNANGDYTLKVTGGNWGTNVSGGWDQYGNPVSVDWIYSGMPNDISFANDSSSESTTVNLSVTTANSIITGKVVYPNGSAAANIDVNMWSQSGGSANGRTNSSGDFTIRNAAGTYEIMGWFPPEKSQYTFPRTIVTVEENQTKNIGTITIQQKTSKVTGTVSTTSGQPLANVRIGAFSMGGPGDYSEAQTNSSGQYTMWISEGRIGVEAQQSPESPFVPAESVKEINVSSNKTYTANFKMIEADVTIKVKVVNQQNVLQSDFYGYAEVRDAETSFGPGPGNFYGAPIENGIAQIKVPSQKMSNVIVTSFVEPGRDYSIEEEIALTIAPNKTYNAVLRLVPNDAVMMGVVKDNYGKPVTDFNFGDVFIQGSAGWNNAQIEPDGSYRISLRSGTYEGRGAFIEGGNYINGPPEFDNEIVIPVGTTTWNPTLYRADATITGTLLDPDGKRMSGFGFIFAHENCEEVGKSMKECINSGTEVRDGRFTLNVVGGKTYFLGASVPPNFDDNNWMPPQETIISVAKNGSKNITLRFKEADGRITGQVKYEDGSPVMFGYVDGWADGPNSGSEIFNGRYSLPVTGDDTWSIESMTFSGTNFYSSGDTRIATPDEKGFVIERDLIVYKSQFKFPESTCETWSVTQPHTLNLSNGSSVQFPAGALGTSGNGTVCAQPTVNLKSDKNNKIATGFGYSLTATVDGQDVSQFNSAVTVTFPAELSLLAEQGLTPQDLLPAFYDSTKNTWTRIDSYSINETEGTITFTTTHFTDFAIVTGASTTLSGGPNSLLVSPQAGGGPHLRIYDSNFNLSNEWMAYAPGFRGGIHSISADLDGDKIDEIVTVPASNGGPHLRVFNAEGIELAGEFATTPGYRSGFQIASGDVDGDGKNEIILGANVGGGPQVIVYSYADGTLTKDAVFYAYASQIRTGIQIAVGDVDGDGTAEIVTSANVGGGPHIRIFNGNGIAEGGFFAYPVGMKNGVTISLADVDGNGALDIITTPGKNSPANIAVWDANGNMMSGFYALPEDNRVGVTTQAIDIDGDGTIEIITTPLIGGGPQVSIFDWRGNVEKRFFAYQDWLRTGVRAVVSDIDNDGDVEIITAPRKGGGPLISVFDSNGNVQKRFYSHSPAFKEGVELNLGNE